MNKEYPDQPQSITLEEVTRRAIEMTLRDGGHVPALLVEGNQGAVLIQIEDVPPTHEGRLKQMFTLGFSLARYEAIGRLEQVFFVTEGWMSVAEDGTLPEQLPSQDPNRKEVLIVSVYQPSEQKAGGTLVEMLRDDAGNLTELKPLEGMLEEDSRMESPLLVAFAQGFMRGLKEPPMGRGDPL